MNVKKANKILILIHCIFALCIMISCRNEGNVSGDDTTGKYQLINVETHSEKECFNGFGSITYSQKNILSSECSGTLCEFNFHEGEQVRKNQVVAKLKNVQLEIQCEQYRNAVKSAESALLILNSQLIDEELAAENKMLTLERLRLSIEQTEIELNLLKENVSNKREIYALGGITAYEMNQLEMQKKSSETELEVLYKQLDSESLGTRDEDFLRAGLGIPTDDTERAEKYKTLATASVRAKITSAETELNNAESALMASEKLLETLVIRSPINGVLASKNYETGEYVKENETIAVVIDISELHAVFSVQEKDIETFTPEMPVTIHIPSVNKTLKSCIYEISPVAESVSGNFSLKAKIQNTDGKIRPGMYFTCSTEKESEKSSLKLPATALCTEKDKTFVYLVKNNRAVKQYVNPEKITDECILLETDGKIKAGDTVINSPDIFIKEGQIVQQ